jgi:hypothetical protein
VNFAAEKVAENAWWPKAQSAAKRAAVALNARGEPAYQLGRPETKVRRKRFGREQQYRAVGATDGHGWFIQAGSYDSDGLLSSPSVLLSTDGILVAGLYFGGGAGQHFVLCENEDGDEQWLLVAHEPFTGPPLGLGVTMHEIDGSTSTFQSRLDEITAGTRMTEHP